MSVCISSEGEYGSHDLDDAYTCRRCHVLDEDTLVAQFRQLRTERDALWTAAKHVVDLTNRNGSDLLVGHAIAVLGLHVEHMPQAWGSPNGEPHDYTQGVLLGREVLSVLTDAGYAVVKLGGPAKPRSSNNPAAVVRRAVAGHVHNDAAEIAVTTDVMTALTDAGFAVVEVDERR